MIEDKYYIAIFKSKSYAIQINYILENLGYKNFQLVSTPCQIQAGCGYSIKFKEMRQLDILKREARSLNTNIESLYCIERKNGSKTIKNLNYLI
ncbi:DUF3343 domain-containing protein [Anaerosalibacter sp. Marseille-P3206]|uniref:DUF3343 domain-containing protein n=1 Tax=Anaerosalibacter sp. Marseille-P3206 TaxID=1871005 RepID=UPI0009852BDD|nr:DUF3343 domain-containing protein [Anaerosalibacter sp. Marseille-P3206]